MTKLQSAPALEKLKDTLKQQVAELDQNYSTEEGYENITKITADENLDPIILGMLTEELDKYFEGQEILAKHIEEKGENYYPRPKDVQFLDLIAKSIQDQIASLDRINSLEDKNKELANQFLETNQNPSSVMEMIAFISNLKTIQATDSLKFTDDTVDGHIKDAIGQITSELYQRTTTSRVDNTLSGADLEKNEQQVERNKTKAVAQTDGKPVEDIQLFPPNGASLNDLFKGIDIESVTRNHTDSANLKELAYALLSEAGEKYIVRKLQEDYDEYDDQFKEENTLYNAVLSGKIGKDFIQLPSELAGFVKKYEV